MKRGGGEGPRRRRGSGEPARGSPRRGGSGKPARRRRVAGGHGGRGSGEGAGTWVLEWGKSLLVAVLLFLVLRAFLIQTFFITSGSMEETLLVGDFLLISRAAYGPQVPGTPWRLPGYESIDRGEIIVFRPPHDPDIDVVKRVIGLPGDTLMMRGKELFRNGERLREPYVRHIDPGGDVRDPWMDWQRAHLLGADTVDAPPSRDNWGPFVVPAGGVFLLGDNRDDSIDSRHWGFLDEDRVKGRALLIYYSYDSGSLRPFPWLTGIRWERLFTRIR